MASSLEEKCPTLEDFQHKLKNVKENDPALVVLNLNNLDSARPEHAIELLDALLNNTFVQTCSLVNCNINNEGGKKLAELISFNTSITSLNAESNRIGPEGMKAIAEAIATSRTLKELKLTNQSQHCGVETERALAKALDSNTTIQKFTISLKDTTSRNTIDRAISRNKELVRKANQAARKGK